MEEAIKTVLNRSTVEVIPSKDKLKALLQSGQKLTVYLGIDPTSPNLHLGHAVALHKLKQFQELGHKVILLVGDFTGTIGDPTGKVSARPKLSPAEVMANAKEYQKQAAKILKFTGPNPAIIKFNSQWLAKLNLSQVIELASLFTVQQLIERDMFITRQREGKPIYLSEFFYPLMQGYD